MPRQTRTHAGMAVGWALLAVVLVSLMAFLAWRLVRCTCASPRRAPLDARTPLSPASSDGPAGQQGAKRGRGSGRGRLAWRVRARGMPQAHAAGPRHAGTRTRPLTCAPPFQAATLACNLAATAVAVAGMATLPRHPTACLQATTSAALGFANGVLADAEGAVAAMRDVSGALRGVRAMVDGGVGDSTQADLEVRGVVWERGLGRGR